MIIYGASGHAKVIIDIIRSVDKVSIDFVVDDNPEIRKLLNFDVQHRLTDAMMNHEVVLAIGNNHIRQKLANKLRVKYHSALIHNSAVVSENAEIGNGTVVMPNTVINSSTSIGKHCIINSGAIVEHDNIIEDFVHISPGATVTGNIQIGEGTQIGAGASIIPGIKIGHWATIGAGAVVINNIPDYAVAVGNPAKIIKYNRIQNE